ncbi:hypothetical protein MNEG_16219 [Monoraphidium neglectum]|uniref:Uncharacterized protein n=1 Tax=Monoraphidium neglectum TaxID=145388 RepID=A0A0D2LI89_9CHLO|nr:hypothetical protein MNEG_16219 [Monoraphidium neglectum]KIY91744.1 hypothetical protein MNEG_16219 [Monoraphidium neglectum]|eukprot:XP_013890764.1 hypothetical protein MNEG_16219 [Monoraphidium neglectum]
MAPLRAEHADAADAAAPAPPAQRAPSGALPSWLWPLGRDAVRGSSTEELTRAIAAAGDDAAALQRIARGLLAERNDHREESRRWEAAARALETQLADARRARSGLLERLQLLERQVSVLKEDTLVDRLVEAKLATAQRDLEAEELRGGLRRERERARQLAARLTAAQGRYDALANRVAAAGGLAT